MGEAFDRVSKITLAMPIPVAAMNATTRRKRRYKRVSFILVLPRPA
jgi:hypothetical protein